MIDCGISYTETLKQLEDGHTVTDGKREWVRISSWNWSDEYIAAQNVATHMRLARIEEKLDALVEALLKTVK